MGCAGLFQGAPGFFLWVPWSFFGDVEEVPESSHVSHRVFQGSFIGVKESLGELMGGSVFTLYQVSKSGFGETYFFWGGYHI